jgi:hypothetical protein
MYISACAFFVAWAHHRFYELAVQYRLLFSMQHTTWRHFHSERTPLSSLSSFQRGIWNIRWPRQGRSGERAISRKPLHHLPAEGRPKNQLGGSPNCEKSGGFLYSVYIFLLAAKHGRAKPRVCYHGEKNQTNTRFFLKKTHFARAGLHLDWLKKSARSAQA